MRNWTITLLLAPCCCAFVVTYSNDAVLLDTIVWTEQGLYTANDSPAIGAPGNGRSFIKFDLQFERKLAVNDDLMYAVGEIEVAAFETSSFNKLGYIPIGQTTREYCCNKLAIENKVCSTLNSIIVPEDARDEVRVWKIDISGENKDSTIVTMKGKQFVYPVQKSGPHYVLFSRCDQGIGDVYVTGTTEWMNPYGYLSGELYGSLSFTAVMSMLYFVVAVLWFISCFCFWRDLQDVQNWISALVGLAMIQNSLAYFELIKWNEDGVRSSAFLGFVLFFCVLKDSVARFLLLVVSMGYGVVKPSLGTVFYKCLTCTGCYFIAAFAQKMAQESSHGKPGAIMMYLMLIPVAVLNGVFFFWIFSALQSTIYHLKNKKQSAKLWLFNTFQKMLASTLFVAVVWDVFCIMEVYRSKISPSSSDNWQYSWVYTSLWELLFFLLFLGTAFLWRPSKNALQYSYMTQLATDESEVAQDDEEYLDGLESSAPPHKVFELPGVSKAFELPGVRTATNKCKNRLRSVKTLTLMESLCELSSRLPSTLNVTDLDCIHSIIATSECGRWKEYSFSALLRDCESHWTKCSHVNHLFLIRYCLIKGASLPSSHFKQIVQSLIIPTLRQEDIPSFLFDGIMYTLRIYFASPSFVDGGTFLILKSIEDAFATLPSATMDVSDAIPPEFKTNLRICKSIVPFISSIVATDEATGSIGLSVIESAVTLLKCKCDAVRHAVLSTLIPEIITERKALMQRGSLNHLLEEVLQYTIDSSSLNIKRDGYTLLARLCYNYSSCKMDVLEQFWEWLLDGFLSGDEAIQKCCIFILKFILEVVEGSISSTEVMVDATEKAKIQGKLKMWGEFLKLYEVLDNFSMHLIEPLIENCMKDLIAYTTHYDPTLKYSKVVEGLILCDVDFPWMSIVLKKAFLHSNPPLRKLALDTYLKIPQKLSHTNVYFVSRDLVKYLNDPSLYHWNMTKSIAPQVIKFFVGIVESTDLELVTLLTGQFIASLLHFVDGFYSIDVFFSIFRKRLWKPSGVISTPELIEFRKFIVFIQQTGYVFSSEYESIVWTLIDHTAVSEMDTLEFLRVLSSFPASRVIQSIPELLAAFKSWMCTNKVCLRNSIIKSIITFLGEEDGINEGTYEIADAFSCLLRCEENINEALALLSPVFNVARSIYSQPYLKDAMAKKCLILLGILPEISLSFGQEGDVYTRKVLGTATAEVLSYLRVYLFTPELDKCHLSALRTLLHFHAVNDTLEPVLFDFCISTYPEVLKQVHMGRPLEALKVANIIMECYSPIAIRFDVESHIELFRARPPTSLDPEAKKTFFHLKWKVLDVIIKELSKREKLAAISGIYLEELFDGAVEALESAFVSYAHHVFNVLFYLVDIRFSPTVLENPEKRDQLVSNLYSCCWTAFQDFRTNEVVSESFVSLLLHPKFLTCEGLNEKGSGITFKVFHRIIPNKSLAKPLLRKCIPIWTTHLSSAEYYIDSLIELILFGDSRLEGYDAIQYAYKMQNTAEDDKNLFIRVILTLWLSELSSSKGGGTFVLQVITLLLHKSQVLESLKSAPKPTGNKKKEAKVELSLAKCGQLRAWQTASCLLRSMSSLSSSDVNAILESAVLTLHEKHLPNIRFAVESVCLTLATRYPSAFYNETIMKLLSDPNAPDAVVKSLLVVIGISLDVMPVTNPSRKDVLLQVMDILVVYLASTDGLHRTFSHMIFHKHFQEWFSLHAVSPTLDNVCLNSMWNFLDKNMKVARMREKQLPYVDKFYEIFSSFSSPMSMKLSPLDFTDDFISPMLLEDVEETMREVFFEYYNEDWYCFTELYSANRPPDETSDIYAQAVQPNESNFQRKILPWSNEIESTTGTAREVMAASRKRQDIIVFASFVDKMPNIAGLVRTCEIFAASKLVIPYMKMIEREEFSHISVTAEKWIDLEEVTEDNTLGWLKRKKEVEGYSLIGLEQTAGSVPLPDYVFPEKCIIILGKEKEGIPLPVLHLVDAAVEIPQFGIIRSLNVHVAGSLLLWEYTRQQILNKRH